MPILQDISVVPAILIPIGEWWNKNPKLGNTHGGNMELQFWKRNPGSFLERKTSQKLDFVSKLDTVTWCAIINCDTVCYYQFRN